MWFLFFTYPMSKNSIPWNFEWWWMTGLNKYFGVTLESKKLYILWLLPSKYQETGEKYLSIVYVFHFQFQNWLNYWAISLFYCLLKRHTSSLLCHPCYKVYKKMFPVSLIGVWLSCIVSAQMLTHLAKLWEGCQEAPNSHPRLSTCPHYFGPVSVLQWLSLFIYKLGITWPSCLLGLFKNRPRISIQRSYNCKSAI